jgi:hypothetical protein
MHPPHAPLMITPHLAMYPDKVDITAAMHMASLVDAYTTHSGCPSPHNPHMRPRALQHSIAEDMYHQPIFNRGGSLACRTQKPFPIR